MSTVSAPTVARASSTSPDTGASRYLYARRAPRRRTQSLKLAFQSVLVSPRVAVEARELLGSVYNWFTEGLDAADLKEAKALLKELS